LEKFQKITINSKDKRYPKLLGQIHDFPKTIYCRGNLDLLNKTCLAVVGTRKLTSYGKEVTQNIVRDLVKTGFVIVSGLAFGIDSIAHQTTLDVSGKTIAVLGGGVEDKHVGPQTNLPLAQNILKKGGLLLSEYSGQENIRPANFALRDRIISGLSKGVIVIEAPEQSGALITAKCALDQNRDVFAVPGSIFSLNSIGPNNLIKTGAKLVSSAQDILDEYGENLKLFEDLKPAISTRDPIQKIILAILDNNGTVFIDEIIRESEKETSKIIAALSVLEIKGLIKNIGNGKYRKT
jgi:DNA processing protein